LPLFLLLKVDLFHHHMGLLKDFLEELVQMLIKVVVEEEPVAQALPVLHQILPDLEELEEQHSLEILAFHPHMEHLDHHQVDGLVAEEDPVEDLVKELVELEEAVLEDLHHHLLVLELPEQ
jgi:hypothetical protein